MNFFLSEISSKRTRVAFVNSLSSVPLTSSLITAASHSLLQQSFWLILEDRRSRGSRGYLLYRIPKWQFLIIFCYSELLEKAVILLSLKLAPWVPRPDKGYCSKAFDWLYFRALENLLMVISNHFLLYKIVRPKEPWIWPNFHFF